MPLHKAGAEGAARCRREPAGAAGVGVSVASSAGLGEAGAVPSCPAWPGGQRRGPGREEAGAAAGIPGFRCDERGLQPSGEH